MRRVSFFRQGEKVFSINSSAGNVSAAFWDRSYRCSVSCPMVQKSGTLGARQARLRPMEAPSGRMRASILKVVDRVFSEEQRLRCLRCCGWLSRVRVQQLLLYKVLRAFLFVGVSSRSCTMLVYRWFVSYHISRPSFRFSCAVYVVFFWFR